MTVAAPPVSEADDVIAFIEGYCQPSKTSDPLRLRDWQKDIVRGIFETDAEGRRIRRTAYVGLARKNGKSTLGAALALYGLVVDPVEGAEVYSVAGDRAQARVVFDEARAMAQAHPELAEKVRVYRHHIEVPETRAIYRVLSADAPRAQGLNPSFVLFDEVHVQPNDELWVAMRMGMGAREQPLMVAITTAGFDRGSLAWRLYEHGRKVRSGEVVDPAFYFYWREPTDPNADHRDESVWAEANPALGDFLHLEALRDDLAEPEHHFRRYHLNQWTTTRDAWLPHGAWDAIADPDRKVDPETPCVLFFDGSWTGDSTGIAGMTLEQRPHLFVVDAWEPSQTGRHVERDDVERAIYRATEDHRVRYIGADPHEWRGELQKWYDDGLPIVEWPTNAIARMVEACGEFYRGVMTKAFTHDGDPRLLRHITNAVVKVDRIGARIVKNSSREKIDLAVAAVGAYDLVLRHRDEDFSDATVMLLD